MSGRNLSGGFILRSSPPTITSLISKGCRKCLAGGRLQFSSKYVNSTNHAADVFEAGRCDSWFSMRKIMYLKSNHNKKKIVKTIRRLINAYG